MTNKGAQFREAWKGLFEAKRLVLQLTKDSRPCVVSAAGATHESGATEGVVTEAHSGSSDGQSAPGNPEQHPERPTRISISLGKELLGNPEQSSRGNASLEHQYSVRNLEYPTLGSRNLEQSYPVGLPGNLEQESARGSTEPELGQQEDACEPLITLGTETTAATSTAGELRFTC